MNIYHIDITDGFIKFDDFPAPRVSDQHHAPNAKQYFLYRNKVKPTRIKVAGQPFQSMYLTNGDANNGLAIAWSKPKNPYYD